MTRTLRRIVILSTVAAGIGAPIRAGEPSGTFTAADARWLAQSWSEAVFQSKMDDVHACIRCAAMAGRFSMNYYLIGKPENFDPMTVDRIGRTLRAEGFGVRFGIVPGSSLRYWAISWEGLRR